MFNWVSWLWKEGQPFSVDEEDRVTFLDSTSMILNYLLQQNTEHAMWSFRGSLLKFDFYSSPSYFYQSQWEVRSPWNS